MDRAISNALEEMTRLSGIVDSLITLSRMESLWGKRAHARVDLKALAEETIEQMNLMAEEKHIALTRPSGLPVIVAGDRDRLKQVLVNLIDNAIKYTPAGGHVAVEAGVEGDKGFVTVEDSGIGIDPAHQERVFDRFYRVSPDRGEVGAGLGLAIVKSICHAHGGTVSAAQRSGDRKLLQESRYRCCRRAPKTKWPPRMPRRPASAAPGIASERVIADAGEDHAVVGGRA